jgi:hypothetical protein
MLDDVTMVRLLDVAVLAIAGTLEDKTQEAAGYSGFVGKFCDRGLVGTTMPITPAYPFKGPADDPGTSGTRKGGQSTLHPVASMCSAIGLQIEIFQQFLSTFDSRG